MKWLYIKNGDVVAQLRRVSAAPAAVAEAGPDAFIADFICGISGQSALMISWGKKHDECIDGALRARMYRVAGSRAGRLGNALLRIAASIAGAREMLAFRPDRIICGQVGPMLWTSALVARRLGCPLVHSRHNSLYERQAKWYQRLLSRLDFVAIRGARAVICHGPFLVRQMREIGLPAERIFEFDVGFSQFQASAATSRAMAAFEDVRTLLYVGRIERNKGVFDLLEAFATLATRDNTVRLRYVGDGPDLERLRGAVREKGLTARVECIGRVRHDELPGIISSSSLMVTPTRREFPEGRCMAAMEALACAVPVVAPAYGPFPDLVKPEENGLLYEPDDVTALTQAISRTLLEPGLYQKLQAGAARTAVVLRRPVRTFHQAVLQAFDA